MTVSILDGTPERDKTVYKRDRSKELYVGSGEVDKAHEQRGVLLRLSLQASNHEHYVGGRALGI